MSFTTFLGLEHGSSLAAMQGQKALGFHKKYLNLCSMRVSNLMTEFSFCNVFHCYPMDIFHISGLGMQGGTP